MRDSKRLRRTSALARKALARKALARKALARKALAGLATLALLGSSLSTPAPARAAATRGHAPSPQRDHIVPGHLAPPPAHRAGRPAIKPFHAPASVWPAAVTATVPLRGTPSAPPLPRGLRRDLIAAPAPAMTRVGHGPLWIGESQARRQSRVRVRIFGHAMAKKAGVDGVLIQLANADTAKKAGPVAISLDYAKFRWAYGGNWADRLQLVELTCATSSPAPAHCRMSPLRYRNDVATSQLSTTMTIKPSPGRGAVLLAATSSPSGSAGDFTATSLSASSSWSVGGNTGNFTWSYPLRTPPALGGPVPSLSLSYDSSAVDGQVASSNNQPSWVGQGFDLNTGYIERSYTPCADDMGGNANNTLATGDLCWGANNATMVMAGHSGELIQDAGDPNRWHLRGEDGTYIRHLTGASNGGNGGEYWVVTTPDGTQYWFGKNASSNNSAWTEPVYGNNPGEPCHASTFAASSCTQVYRWNLDHVVDPSGNTMDYFYTTETNMYAADDSQNSPVSYIRGGYLNKITYGTRTGSTGNAPMQVVFAAGQRCVTSSCGTHDGTNWPDTPWDMACTGSPCLIGTPTYWNTDRLATISTQLYSGTGTTYNTVTTWTLTHTMPDPGDGTDAALWLSSIVQTGQDGSPAITLPPVTFVPLQLANRVDTQGGALPPMNWMRMSTITTETGSQIQVTYNPSTCVAGTASMPNPSALQNNTYTCYPVIWQPPGNSSPITDFFNKYTVAQVNVADLTTPGNPATVTSYKYSGSPAWHYTDTTGIVPAKARTWSVWRGYPQVEKDTGTGADEQSVVTTYFQGMNGDLLPGNTTRSVTLPAIDVNENGTTTDQADAPAVPDDDALTGMVREAVTYNGPGGAEVKAVVNNPFESAPTASTTVNGVTVTARFTGIADTHARTDLDGGRAPLTTSTHTVFDSMGDPVQQQSNGNDAVSGDERCTLTSYARNQASDGSTWLVNFPDRVQQFATDCATAQAAGLTADQVINDTLTYYDGSTTLGTAPSRGLVTRTDVLKAWSSGTPSYLTTALATYDANGRVTSSTDVRNNATTTAYATNAGGQVSTMTGTSALGWVTTTILDPATGETVQTTDPNGRITSEAYDAMGRLVSVWRPGRDKSTQSANLTYAYLIRNNAPSTVTTSRLTPSGGYVTTYALYDGLLRPIQTQAPRGDGAPGALLTDTFYDSAGRAYQANSSYLAAITPGTTLFVPNEQNVPQRTVTSYDGDGRATQQVVYNLNGQGVSVPFATTTTAYGGDRTDVTPPAGGVATSTLTDVYGDNVAIRQYHGATPTPFTAGTYDTTSYAYNNKSQLVTVTDAAGNKWTTSYDIRGRVISATDPDSGTTTTSYDDAGDVTSTTDGRGVTLNYTYDSLGRKTGVYNGAVNAADQLGAWTYDGLANSRGQLTKSVSYDGGNAYAMAINGFTAAYQPTSVSYTVPAAETGLAGTYTYVYTYSADGSPATTRIPAAGGLATETLTDSYTALAQPSGLSTSIPATTSLVQSVSYTGYGEPAVVTLQTNGGSQVYQSYTYDPSNRRLTEQAVTKQASPTSVADLHYAYDPSGNIVSADDSVSGDNQCFSYDYADRLTSAWTPAGGNCTAAKSVAALGGPGAYWDDWTFNVAGTRTGQVAHDTPNGVATTTYAVPAPGAAQPHAVTSATTTSSAGTTTSTYGYNAGGFEVSRPSPNGPASQSLTYNAQGNLATVTDNGSMTSYTYDVAGATLIERDATGKTLYLPGQELRYTASTGAKAATRYYTMLGQTIAMRTASGVTWMMADRQNSVNLTIDNLTQAVAERWLDPYGSPRGAGTGTWPAADTKGYIGGTPNSDGLTTLGIRQYDPALGRFTSIDPIRPAAQPQRLDPYSYCAGNPVAASDPSGSLPAPGQWTPEYGVLDGDPWSRDGYHYQYVDVTSYWCKDNGTQCWGQIIGKYGGRHGNGGYFYLDQEDREIPADVAAPGGIWRWINPGQTLVYLNETDILGVGFISQLTKQLFRDGSPVNSGGGSGGGGSGSGSSGSGSGTPTPPVNNKPDGPFATAPPTPPSNSGNDVNPICGTFLGFICPALGAVNDAANFLGGWENVFKYAADGLLAGGCLLASAGTAAVACATLTPILVGTAFNVLDTAMAGGISGPNPDTNWRNFTNFVSNEALTVGFGLILPNDSWAGQIFSIVGNGPQSPTAQFWGNILYGPQG